MVYNLSSTSNIAQTFVAELRDVAIQQDRMRFRKNLERLGFVLAYELSKKLQYQAKEIETQLGIAEAQLLIEQPIVGSILRAGLPMHQGVLDVFDRAENAFVSAYRRHHKDGSFEIKLEYVSCPEIDGKVLVLVDPMLATGASIVSALQELYRKGEPKETHLITAIASTEGIDRLKRQVDSIHIWTGAIDQELTAKSYIVPGLGDAGDLAFGEKL